MKAIIELNSVECPKKYSNELLVKITEDTIVSSGIFVHDEIMITVSVAIVGNDEIKKVNSQLRGKNKVTDVISVGEYSDENNISEVQNGEVFLGEVILCYNYIKESAQENNISIDEEFFTVYVHGILHLLGIKHGPEMFKVQNEIALKFL